MCCQPHFVWLENLGSVQNKPLRIKNKIFLILTMYRIHMKRFKSKLPTTQELQGRKYFNKNGFDQMRCYGKHMKWHFKLFFLTLVHSFLRHTVDIDALIMVSQAWYFAYNLVSRYFAGNRLARVIWKCYQYLGIGHQMTVAQAVNLTPSVPSEKTTLWMSM